MSKAADNYKKKMASGLKLLRDTPPTINTTDNGPEGMMGRAKAKLSRLLVDPARKSIILTRAEAEALLRTNADLERLLKLAVAAMLRAGPAVNMAGTPQVIEQYDAALGKIGQARCSCTASGETKPDKDCLSCEGTGYEPANDHIADLCAGPENHIANAGKMVVEDGVVAELRAIDEEAMYQQPATTHKAINRAAARIEALLRTNADQLECIAELQETAELFVGLREYVADLERKLGVAVETLEAARRECGRMHGYRNMEESISYILTLCDAALNDITGEGVR